MIPQQNVKQCDIVYTLMQFKYMIILATYSISLLPFGRHHVFEQQSNIMVVHK